MTNKIISLFLLVFVLTLTSYGQSLLNGDFEINSAGIDQINLVNSQYDSLMTNSKAFGNFSGGGANGGNMDIITSDFYCDLPQNGNWYVALTSGGSDAFSLKLSSPLIVGLNYSLTFYDRSCSPYPAGSPIKIGVSNSNDNFGNLVYIAPVPVYNGVWSQRTFSFIAPISATYITVTCDSIDSGSPWTQVDNFSIEETASIQTVQQNSYFEIFPNPTSNEINIKPFGNYDQLVSVKVLNQFGQELFKSKFVEKIDVSDFANGLYILEIRTDNKTHYSNFLKQ